MGHHLLLTLNNLEYLLAVLRFLLRILQILLGDALESTLLNLSHNFLLLHLLRGVCQTYISHLIRRLLLLLLHLHQVLNLLQSLKGLILQLTLNLPINHLRLCIGKGLGQVDHLGVAFDDHAVIDGGVHLLPDGHADVLLDRCCRLLLFLIHLEILQYLLNFSYFKFQMILDIFK